MNFGPRLTKFVARFRPGTFTAPEHCAQWLLTASLWTMGSCFTADPEATVSSKNQVSTEEEASPTPTPVANSQDIRSFRIRFQTQDYGGSFTNSPPSAGTTPLTGSGWAANKLFTPKNEELAVGSTHALWPKWLSRFEVGLSGSANAVATNQECARFATASEVSLTDQCRLYDVAGTTPYPFNCRVTGAGQFRISEFNCPNESVTGSGATSDEIYVRGIFDRSYLLPNENLLVTIEYSASTLHGPPTNVASCFTNGEFNPSNIECSEMTYYWYLKSNAAQTPARFQIFIPPAQVTTNTLDRGTSIRTAQLIVPFAANPDATILQLSRIRAKSSLANTVLGDNADSYCEDSSPFCMGLVIYSMSFFRI